MKEIYRKIFDLLTEYNSKINLTAITTYEDYLVKHVEDSKVGLPYVYGKVLDIGSGAGFPALVLKTENPEIDLTMLDSVGKKVNYLNEVIKQLGFTGAKAVHARIEDFEGLETYDVVSARAVAKLCTLVEYALPFLKVGGKLVAYKSENVEDEVREAQKVIRMLGGKVTEIVTAQVGDMTRKLVIVEKIKQSPKGYPRKGNKPRLLPIV